MSCKRDILLKVNKIDISYGDLQVLHEISFEVNEGEIVTLVGANGAGKSTVLKTLSGSLAPFSGSIEFLGKRIDKLPADKIVEIGISHVPEGRSLFSTMTVLENLEMGAYTSKARKDKQKTLDEVYEIFPVLKERKKQLAGTLSGGEQQILAIARGLMSKPRLLLLDEPSLGLAPILVRKTMQTTQEINKRGVTVLLVEQNVHYALMIASRGYIIENGRIVLEGESKSLSENANVKKAYLGM